MTALSNLVAVKMWANEGQFYAIAVNRKLGHVRSKSLRFSATVR